MKNAENKRAENRARGRSEKKAKNVRAFSLRNFFITLINKTIIFIKRMW